MWGNDSIWRSAHFSNGLVQPPTTFEEPQDIPQGVDVFHKVQIEQRLEADIPLDWWIGILLMAYYNPHIARLYNPLYTAFIARVLFTAQMEEMLGWF